jgi:hypothetical protein
MNFSFNIEELEVFLAFEISQAAPRGYALGIISRCRRASGLQSSVQGPLERNKIFCPPE